ncbi:MAG: choline-sulfatase [Alphaproteobacteria bacterium]|nr:choline-sulfatase [Alphaproteobacteria bacterium]
MARDLPNILLIQADQLKPQLLPGYGGSAVMPNIGRLCEEGVMFANAYCNFPLCAPSRFSMLAGMLPSRVRAFDNGAEFAAATPTMAHYLRLAGYRTALAGKQHFVGPDMLHGFHERLVPELYPTDFHWTPSWEEVRMESNNNSSGVIRSGISSRSMQMDHDDAVLSRSVEWLKQVARSSERQPFFLSVSFTHPHEPYFARREHWDRYRHEDIPMPATPLLPEQERDLHSRRMLAHHGLLEGDIDDSHVRIARHAYYANCSWLDDMVGTLMEVLEVEDLGHDTAIVLTSDHGDMLGERGLWFKKHFFDHAARVPLILHAPGRFAAARRPEPVSLVDLLPTFCDLADIDLADRAPRPPDGLSLLPLCENASAARDRAVLAEITSEGVPSPMFMVRSGCLKLMTGGHAPDLLFDLEADPEERINLAADPESAAALAALRRVADLTWDPGALEAEIRASQRERRLVQAAHGHGPVPVWDALESDPVRASCLRAPDDYNDWAWRGIVPSGP